MAMLLIEGFDDGLVGKRGFHAAPIPSSSYGRNGNGIRVGDYPNTSLQIVHGSTNTTLIAGMSFKLVTVGSKKTLFGFVDDATSSGTSFGIHVRFDPVNNRLLVEDLTGEVNTAATGSVVKNAWYYVELKVVFSDTTGSWELRVDGDSYLSATSRDTVRTNTPPTYFVTAGNSSYDVEDAYLDDLYLFDGSGSFNNTFAGIVKVETLLPNGNGTYSNMTGSDGNSTDNYLLVDNNASIPPSTTEYVGSATEGDKDTYAMSDLSGTPTVIGVQTSVYAAKSDTGAKYMRTVIRSGSTDYTGTSKALADSVYVSIDEHYDSDPNTSSAWTYSGVNSLEVGQEVRDS